MKRTILLSIVVLVWAAGAWAEPISLTNKITEIGPSDDYFKMYRLNPQTQDAEEVRIEIEPSTLFSGTDSIRGLSVGDIVAVRADLNNFTHEMTAQLVEPVVKKEAA